MANLKELLKKMVSGAEEYLWNGITPESVALIFVRSPEEGARSHMGQQALVCNSYPIPQDDANECGERFCEPTWQYVGLVFAYRHPNGDTQFEAHPDPEVSDEKWIQMMKAPVSGTGLTYQEKIMCRLTGLSYQEYLDLKKKEGGAVNDKEPGADMAQESEAGGRPRLKPIAGLSSSRQVEAATMKGKNPDLPQHECSKQGNPRFGFAEMDLSIMKSPMDRFASGEEIGAQIGEWIRADAAKNPNLADPVAKRLRVALLSNNPSAVYCTSCLETICLIYPEQMEEATRLVKITRHQR